jgi:hypothetical protein
MISMGCDLGVDKWGVVVGLVVTSMPEGKRKEN